MSNLCIPPRITRTFPKSGTRFECQFRDRLQGSFITDCTMDELDYALSYVSLVVRFVSRIAEGMVFDSKTQQVIFACKMLVDPRQVQARRIREVPADYAQLAMLGFNSQAAQKENKSRKRKVDETLARLRQLHDELNAQLYTKPTERPKIQSPADAANILQCFIGNLDHEELWVINLDTRVRIMSLIALYKGSVNQSSVRVSEVFRQAILDNSPSIIVSHNHPSGDPSPSPDDVAVTRCIVQAGKLLDIEVLDHIVIASSRFVSLKERGLGFS